MNLRIILRLSLHILLYLLIIVLCSSAYGSILDVLVNDRDGRPADKVIFQIFPGRIDISSDVIPINLGNYLSDKIDNDGDGIIDEANEDFLGYATSKDGSLRLNLKDGLYTIVGFSCERRIVLVKEVSVPGSVVINASDTVPVNVSCRDINGSPIIGAEIFFRPTKRARASVGYTDNNGLLRAYVSAGEYNAVLWSVTGRGPHYLILPNLKVTFPQSNVYFHVRDIPTCELNFDLPKGTALAIFEVLESTYTIEYAEGLEPEIGYDAAYTDFYPIVTREHPYTLSAGMDYNFNMSFAVSFGQGNIYAYELRPSVHSIEPGTTRLGITEVEKFKLYISSNRGDSDPVFYPGEKVTLSYKFTDSKGNMLNRMLNFTGARLIFPMVTIWNSNGVAIANNFNTDDFFNFTFALPQTAVLGEYRADIFLDAGIFGKVDGSFKFHVHSVPDNVPPDIVVLSSIAEGEAGTEFLVSARISDNVGLAGKPKFRLSDDGILWQDFNMDLSGKDNYQTKITLPSKTGEFKWQISATDMAGNRSEKSGTLKIVDKSPPVIMHNVISKAEAQVDLKIQAEVRDNTDIKEVILFYSSTQKGYKDIEMLKSNDTYYVVIPGEEISYDGLSYYLKAVDISGNSVLYPSEPAKISVEDSISPTIVHNPVKVAFANTPIIISAIITDNVGVSSATLFYKNKQDYKSIPMSMNGRIFYAEIPADEVIPDNIMYHIQAYDLLDPDGKTRSTVVPSIGEDYIITVSNVSYDNISKLELTPSSSQDSPLSVISGERVKFSAVGYTDSGMMVPINVVWLVIGGIGHIDQDGTFIAEGKINEKIGKVSAIGINNGLIAESWIQVSPGLPQYISLEPSSVVMIAGGSQKFYANVTDIFSNYVDSANINFSFNGSMPYNISSKGKEVTLSIYGTGKGILTAEINGIKAISEINVIPGPLSSINILSESKSKPAIVNAGKTLKFTAIGYDNYNNPINIAPKWSVIGGIGTINGDGLFTGGLVGDGRIMASVGDVFAMYDITVVPGTLHSVIVTPYTAYLPVTTSSYKSVQQFFAEGRDIAGNYVPLKKITWSTDNMAGTITSDGLFTAITDPMVSIGETITNGTIYAVGTPYSGNSVTGMGYVVIMKTPASQLASISVVKHGSSSSAESISIATGEKIRFEAVGSDIKGRKIAVNPMWSVSGNIGNIDPGGVFTAIKPGKGEVIASIAGFTGRIQVNVTLGAIKYISIKPSILYMIPDKQTTLNVVGYDLYDNVVSVSDVKWSLQGNAVTIYPEGSSCVVNVNEIKQDFDPVCIISARVGDLVAYTNVFVLFSGAFLSSYKQSDNPSPYFLQVEPNIVTIRPGGKLQFKAFAYNFDRDEFITKDLSWNVIGNIGKVDDSGFFTSMSNESSGRIIVTDGNLFGSAFVNISAEANTESLIIVPSNVSLVAGSYQRFFAFTNNFVPIDKSLIWRVVGNIGTIDTYGNFLATGAGNGIIEVEAGNLIARCNVVVYPGDPASIEIQPGSLSLEYGKQQRLSARVKDKMGNLVNSVPEYYLAGGDNNELNMITEDGLLTGLKAGQKSILGVLNGLISKVDVVVKPNDPARIEIFPDNLSVIAGSSVHFYAIGKDTGDNLIPVDPIWDVIDNVEIGWVSSNGVFFADKAGRGRIRARYGNIEGYINIEVLPASPEFIIVEPSLVYILYQSAERKQFNAYFLDSKGNIVKPYNEPAISWATTGDIGVIDTKTGIFVNKTDLTESRNGYVFITAIFNAGTNLEKIVRGIATIILQPAQKALSKIIVTPDSVLVIKGDTQKFIATGKDSDGADVEVDPSWSVISSDGRIVKNISSDGVFKADMDMEIGSKWKIVANVRNVDGQVISGEAVITLIAGPLYSIELVCERDLCNFPVESGKIVEISAIGYDRFQNIVEVSPEWKVDGGIGVINPGTGKKVEFTAGLAGMGKIVALSAGKEGKILINVIPGPLADIRVFTDPPQTDSNVGTGKENPLIVKSGSELLFIAKGYDSNIDQKGRVKPVNSINITPQWSISNSDIGSLSSGGKFVGKESGEAIIEARSGSINSQFYVKVIPGDLASIKVVPYSVTLVLEKDNNQQFIAFGYDKYGNQIENIKFQWQVNGNIGNIDQSGLFVLTAKDNADGVIIASSGKIQGVASISIVHWIGELKKLTVNINPSVIQAGGKADCIIKGFDESGNPITDLPSINLSVSSIYGVLSVSDTPNTWTFRAEKKLPAERKGILNVTAEIGDKIISTSAQFELIPAELNKVIIEPTVASVIAGNEYSFRAFAYDAYDNQIEFNVMEWSILGEIGKITKNDIKECVFSAVTTGNGKIIARLKGFEGKADITVLPGEADSLEIRPKSLLISAGSTYQFYGILKDRFGNEIPDVKLNWQMDGEIVVGSVTDDGVFLGSRSGKGILKVSYQGRYFDSADITVIPGEIYSARIDISDNEKILNLPYKLLSGSRYNLFISGSDSYGNKIDKLDGVVWEISKNLGLLSYRDSEVFITALFPGKGTISASVGKVSVKSDIEIIPYVQKVFSGQSSIINGSLGAYLEIPGNSVRKDFDISISLSNVSVTGIQSRQVGYVYNFEPNGKVFYDTIKITLPYGYLENIDVDENNLVLYSYDNLQKRWIRVGGMVDKYQKSVTASVNYLSFFVIMEEKDIKESGKLSIRDVQISPNAYFAPEVNRLNIRYNIVFSDNQPINTKIDIYDIKGNLIRNLIENSPKYPGWNTDQWDGKDDFGKVVKNGRYFVVITVDVNGFKDSKTKHLAVFK